MLLIASSLYMSRNKLIRPDCYNSTEKKGNNCRGKKWLFNRDWKTEKEKQEA